VTRSPRGRESCLSLLHPSGVQLARLKYLNGNPTIQPIAPLIDEAVSAPMRRPLSPAEPQMTGSERVREGPRQRHLRASTRKVDKGPDAWRVYGDSDREAPTLSSAAPRRLHMHGPLPALLQ